MTAPNTNMMRVGYQNPHASEGLTLSLQIVSNTSIEEIGRNIKENSLKYKRWMRLKEAHDRPAILVGGGDSINDHIEDIRKINGTVFAMNGAAHWCREHGIDVDYQVIVDAKEETAGLVDPNAKAHLFASQVNPKTLEMAGDVILWHLDMGSTEDYLPPKRVKKGGYVLVGGDATVGNCALCAVYTQGYRELHIFGYDSSHRAGKSHGYEQAINKTMPTMEIEWGGRSFEVSIAMKHQAEKFQAYAHALKTAGCTFHVYGDGLLQTIYNSKPRDLSEKEKYQLMWEFDSYRDVSPGEHIAEFFVGHCKPTGKVVDFGCGTGRGGLKIAEAGFDVLLTDFTDNSRDQEALSLPFIQCDLTDQLTATGDWGFCTDVMEHIPPEDVETVIHNIMESTPQCFYQISTIHDGHGSSIGADLHLTVKPHQWWSDLFKGMGYTVEWEHKLDIASLFHVSK